jgi:hypothetical protein
MGDFDFKFVNYTKNNVLKALKEKFAFKLVEECRNTCTFVL